MKLLEKTPARLGTGRPSTTHGPSGCVLAGGYGGSTSAASRGRRRAPAYGQGSRGAPFAVLWPRCLESSFLFRNRASVDPFLRGPAGCCRNTRSLWDWLRPGSFCWCRRRKNSFAPFLKIPPARARHGVSGAAGEKPGGRRVQEERKEGGSLQRL